MQKTEDKILSYIKNHQFASISDIAFEFEISKQMVHRYIKKMLEKGVVLKHGTAPKVFYSFLESKRESFSDKIAIEDSFSKVDREAKDIINENFFLIDPSGKKKEGLDAFVFWCKKRNFSVPKKAKEYVKVFKKYESLKKDGFLNGSSKLSVFKEKCLDGVFYIDFYAFELFGKTKLGQLLLYAKQSQNKKEMLTLINLIKPKIDHFIKKQKIDAVGFIPPTIKRERQFMKFLKEGLDVKVPVLSIVKIKTEVIVPQKTLSKLADRLENAENTIIVDEKRAFKKVLLIDDAIGSGATLHKTACKFKKNKLAKKVIGLAIVGSLKGFDVVSEV